MARLPSAFKRHLASLVSLSPGDAILVAFSGGKDSAALLSLLWDEKASLGFSLHACHVNHGIRGEEADRDEAFCRAFCLERGIPFTVCRADVPGFCKEKNVGVEEGARMERYRLLRETAKRDNCRYIATAHTADDQAETVLFRLARGAGFTGAAGIKPKTKDLIRPLLPFTAKELASYLKENKIPFVEDSSNKDLSYARNRIRQRVLPELAKAVTGAGGSLARFATIAAWQEAFVKKTADAWEIETGNNPSQGKVSFSNAAALTRDEADLPLLYEILCRMTSAQSLSLTRERFLSLVSILQGDKKGRRIEIADGFSFYREKDLLCFGRAPERDDVPSFKRLLRQGNNPIPEIRASLTLSGPTPGKARNIHKNLLIIHAASDRMKGELFVRKASPGDKICMNGMTKSVKKALCDVGVSSEERKRLPVICDDDGIFWVPKLGLCDRGRDPDASFVFTMKLSFDDQNWE